MKFEPLENVAEKLFDWSLRETSCELERNLSLVGCVKGTNAEKYVRFFRQVPPSEATFTARALVKRMNEPVLLRRKAVLTDAEEKRVQAYLQFEEISGPGGTRVVHADQSTVKWTVELRKVLRALVSERFRAEPGTFERSSANECIHKTKIGDVRVSTWMDFGGHSSMSYSHRLSLRDGRPLPAHISILQWLGAASMTRWRALRAEELLDAADALLTLCQHFFQEMSVLFSE